MMVITVTITIIITLSWFLSPTPRRLPELTCEVGQQRRQRRAQEDEPNGGASPGAPLPPRLAQVEPPAGEGAGGAQGQVIPDGGKGREGSRRHGALLRAEGAKDPAGGRRERRAWVFWFKCHLCGIFLGKVVWAGDQCVGNYLLCGIPVWYFTQYDGITCTTPIVILFISFVYTRDLGPIYLTCLPFSLICGDFFNIL